MKFSIMKIHVIGPPRKKGRTKKERTKKSHRSSGAVFREKKKVEKENSEGEGLN